MSKNKVTRTSDIYVQSERKHMGTGNSEYCARFIADRLGDECFNLAERTRVRDFSPLESENPFGEEMRMKPANSFTVGFPSARMVSMLNVSTVVRLASRLSNRWKISL